MTTSGNITYSYGGPQSVFSQPISKRSPKDEGDTEALAGFLLSLKHRSVTPEPQLLQVVDSRTSEEPSSQAETSSQDSSCDTRTRSPFQTLAAGHDSSEIPYVVSQLPQDSEIDVESLIGDSKLVAMEDRELVPDPLFTAMAQMKPCRLQHSDRVGCYKNRELGFVGMCCLHCGGQPGFGRYYPNSVRSLAQTTTSQTILKHIAGKCRICPPHIREAILTLQRQQTIREGLPTGRPRYGSRKIFFQRFWQRLHGSDVEQELEDVIDDKASISAVSKSSFDEEVSSLNSDEDEEVFVANGKRKTTFDSSSSRKRSKSEDSF